MTVCQSTEAVFLIQDCRAQAKVQILFGRRVGLWVVFQSGSLCTSACFRRTRCAIQWSWIPLQRHSPLPISKNVFGFAEALRQNSLARRNDHELRFDVLQLMQGQLSCCARVVSLFFLVFVTVGSLVGCVAG